MKKLENSYTSLISKNRDKYIKEYLKEKGMKKNFSSSNKSIDYSQKIERWNILYNLNRLKQNKLKKQIEEKKKKEEEEFIKKCTFNPKINKKSNYSIYNLNLFQRNNIWNKKKQDKIDYLSKSLNNKLMKNCYFSPEINKENILLNIKIQTNQLLEDPESYNQYIKRLKIKRDNIEYNKKIKNSTPGSGLIWNNKPKKYNLEYDYRNHKIRNEILPKSKSSENINYYNTERYNIINYKDIDKDDYYKTIYLKNCKNVNFNNYNNNNYNYSNHLYKNKKNKEKNIFKKSIEYTKAIKYLHQELYSFPLLQNTDI